VPAHRHRFLQRAMKKAAKWPPLFLLSICFPSPARSMGEGEIQSFALLALARGGPPDRRLVLRLMRIVMLGMIMVALLLLVMIMIMVVMMIVVMVVIVMSMIMVVIMMRMIMVVVMIMLMMSVIMIMLILVLHQSLKLLACHLLFRDSGLGNNVIDNLLLENR